MEARTKVAAAAAMLGCWQTDCEKAIGVIKENKHSPANTKECKSKINRTTRQE
jgi:hypothetical protein